jgi:hypothetical protein
VRRILVAAVLLFGLLGLTTACGNDDTKVTTGDEPSGDVAQPLCVEPERQPAVSNEDGMRIGAEQQSLRGDLEKVQEYGRAHPDEYTSVGFDNEPTIRVFAYFSGHVDDHRAALQNLVAHPDKLEVRESNQSERDQKAIMDSLDHSSGMFKSAGPDSRGPVNISMATTAQALRVATELHERHGDRVCLLLGGHPFPKGAWADTAKCPTEPAPTDRNPSVEFKLELDHTTLHRGEAGTGTARIKNNGTSTISAFTGSDIGANVTRPGSNAIVSHDTGFHTLAGRTLAPKPGETVEIPVRFPTDDCSPNSDYSLPPGEYTVSSYVKEFGRSDEVTITIIE